MKIKPLRDHSEVRTCVFSFDDSYAKYFSVALLSLIGHADEKCTYDIIVLHDGISQDNIELLGRLVPDGFSLRFYNVGAFARETLGDLNSQLSSNQWDVSTFFDLLVPLLMPDYQRVLYCDSDIVFCADPGELFTMPFDGASLIAVRDSFAIAAQIDPDKEFAKKQRSYIADALEIADLHTYFNSGVLVFNIAAIDRDRYLESAKCALALPELLMVDQDALNYMFKGCTQLAPLRFNVQAHLANYANRQNLPQEMWEFAYSLNDPVIIHFTTPQKPWLYPHCVLAECFWAYAQKSPYYEELLRKKQLFLQQRAKAEYSMKRLVRYAVLSKIATGERRAGYKIAYEWQKALYAAMKASS